MVSYYFKLVWSLLRQLPVTTGNVQLYRCSCCCHVLSKSTLIIGTEICVCWIRNNILLKKWGTLKHKKKLREFRGPTYSSWLNHCYDISLWLLGTLHLFLGSDCCHVRRLSLMPCTRLSGTEISVCGKRNKKLCKN